MSGQYRIVNIFVIGGGGSGGIIFAVAYATVFVTQGH